MERKSVRILAISQVYYPDSASVSQHLTDLLEALSAAGYEVTVFSSSRGYEDPRKRFPKRESVNGVTVERISNTGFGKQNKASRLIDFLTFNFLILIKLLSVKRGKFDLLIGMTSPPLLSYLGLKLARLKGLKFIYWAMDLQPELSIVANYVKSGSWTASILQKRADFVFNGADKIIALDSFMKDYICERTANLNDRIDVIPVWPVISEVYMGDRLSNPFRLENNFRDKIVIMYSGNHSVMHPLTTLLDAAVRLRHDKRFLFVHIGGGVGLKEVLDCREEHKLLNIITLPYQPRKNIHNSLGAADIQVVSLGNGCVGFTHPNKVYGSMFIGKPILYIGPSHSHVSEILDKCEGNIAVEHGDVGGLVEMLDRFSKQSDVKRKLIGENNRRFAQDNFHPKKLISDMIASVEKVAF
ncbi:glycosyltransferase family 4 protein [Akkermansiaceae bacterium]|nr:glycosyltransferase family 4 protein [Akkermansiaceae bacterium]